MIFLVSNQQRIYQDNIKQISIDQSLKLLETLKIIGLDTETSGFSPFLKKLLLLQLGCYDFQVVIDTTTINIKEYKHLLESDRLFLGWNLKFDLRFLYYHNIIPKNLYDGYLMEKALWQGYPTGMHSLSLKSAGEEYCNVEVDKSIRGKILWSKTLSDDIVTYAANDVKYLEQIREKQLQKFKERGLQRFIDVDLENKVLPAIAYFEYCGVKLDEEKWKEKIRKDVNLLDSCRENLNKWVEDKYANDIRFCKRNLQGDFWEGFDDSPKCIINWNSPKQVIPLFEEEGFDLLVKDKKTGRLKKSIEATVIEKQKNKSSISKLYLEYAAAQKVVSTYGQNVLDLINPVTGRIHTNINQIGTDTYRLSSGGGEDTEVIPGKKVPLINIQNLPNEEFTRSCFIAEPGNKFISIDFSGEESVILANISQDKAMLELFTTGCKDLHSLVAKMIYKNELKDIPIEKIKKIRPDLRKSAKSPEFAIAYGGDANTLANKDNIPIEEAQKIVNNYMEGFPGVSKYQTYRRKVVMELGYIDGCPEVGYRSYIYDFDRLKEIKKMTSEEGFWDKYRTLKVTDPENSIVQDVKYYFKRKSAIERASINYCIQSRGSAIFKIASVYFFNWIIENNLFNTVKMCIPAHDEFDIEAPDNIADNVAQKLTACMLKAGAFICKLAPLDAEISYDKNGKLTNYWIH